MLRFFGYATLVLVAACLALGVSIALATKRPAPVTATVDQSGLT